MGKLIRSKRFYVDVVLIFVGCLIAALGVNLFLTHAQLLSGGATGIALMFEYITGVQAGIVVFILNVPLFIISLFKLSKKFTLYSGVGMLSLSIALILTKPLSNIIEINDILLYCVYGGVLCGIGYGIVFLRNGSTGGTDIITMLIRKKYSNFEIGKLGFALNLLIIVVGAIIFGIPKALYTLVSIFIQGVVLDKVLRGLNSKNLLLILTNKEEAVIDYIMSDLNRGVTSLISEGEYTHSKRKMLYCILTTNEMLRLKRKLMKIDPSAFITIVDVSEVKGKGFVSI
ncbi:MAG: YitT family protein [Clostridium sp.]|uniref:YitT family protein n=1 Tax=Clostridium TaxID=1485 RepID=UPI00215247BF|nr:YitT family protein [Clostridium sp. LY3-2]MCR6514691.1 YitT family protein [Clostridium sp. LY3-2]